MTVIIPIRSDNSYFGFSLEPTPGTPVAPIWFPRWVDGSSIEIMATMEDVKEGDGTRRLAQVVKNKQEVKIKLVCYPRMNELGILEKMTLGAGSDTITTAASAPAPTTSTGAVTGGSSTAITLTSGTGYSGAGLGNFQLLVGLGTTADPYETVTFNMPASGATLTVASTYNGGKFKSSHSSGTTIASIAIANTSHTSSSSAAGTTITLGNNNGMTGSGTQVLILSPGTVREEVVTVTTPATSGSGPYVFTLAAAAVLKNAHSVADNVSSPVVHVLTDQADGDYWTWEVGLGSLSGAAGTTLRVRSCKVETCKVSSKAGGIIAYELEVVGIASTVQNSPSTVTLEAHPLFLYTQGTWTLDGSTTGDALNIESFDIQRKNQMDTSIQTEQLTLAALIFGFLAVDLGFEIVYVNGNRTFLTYFGSTSGTTDSQVMGVGAWNVAFLQPDNFEQVVYNILTTNYTKIGLPAPKKDGKHFKQAVSAVGTSNAGANAYVEQTTVYNSYYSVY